MDLCFDTRISREDFYLEMFMGSLLPGRFAALLLFIGVKGIAEVI